MIPKRWIEHWTLFIEHVELWNSTLSFLVFLIISWEDVITLLEVYPWPLWPWFIRLSPLLIIINLRLDALIIWHLRDSREEYYPGSYLSDRFAAWPTRCLWSASKVAVTKLGGGDLAPILGYCMTHKLIACTTTSPNHRLGWVPVSRASRCPS